MKPLSEKRISDGVGSYYHKDIKEAIKELKNIGLKKTSYPKYLLLEIDDLIEIFGDALVLKGETNG